MKVDGNAYVNLKRLRALIKDIHEEEKPGEESFILGKKGKDEPERYLNPVFCWGALICFCSFFFKGDKRPEDFCPLYMFNGSRFPAHVEPAGYVMTRAAAECVYSKALTVPYLHLDSVFFTGTSHLFTYFVCLNACFFHCRLLPSRVPVSGGLELWRVSH